MTRTFRYLNLGLQLLKTPSTQPINLSGASHNNQLSAALKLYCKTEGKPFRRLQCFKILVNAEKWNTYCADLELKNTAKKKLASNADPPALVIDLLLEVTPSNATSKVTVVPASSKPGRPIGNQKAKKIKQEDVKSAKWKEDIVGASAGVLETLYAMHQTA
ncbi:hypothetical protein PCANC_01979 [Puccinia coronata f. sp. avenae]|uniref:No apical meristem-associated C-terminal domain-containing protein n=1 Tax=Puccinia coronata f. sp. avenae TaxID=200324 RepID=A0A2N5W1X3_9BASI|nr:hypothetical protein PCANC_01979 [Puccinia coronata f. sp. avenae]